MIKKILSWVTLFVIASLLLGGFPLLHQQLAQVEFGLRRIRKR